MISSTAEAKKGKALLFNHPGGCGRRRRRRRRKKGGEGTGPDKKQGRKKTKKKKRVHRRPAASGYFLYLSDHSNVSNRCGVIFFVLKPLRRKKQLYVYMKH
jgi:hypothetical protein